MVLVKDGYVGDVKTRPKGMLENRERKPPGIPLLVRLCMKGVCGSDTGYESIRSNVFSLHTVHHYGWAGDARHCWNFLSPVPAEACPAGS